MKKALFALLFAASVSHCSAQAMSINEVKKDIKGTWLSRGDSICEMVITDDSITTFRFKAGGVSRCAYKLSTEPCDKTIKFPSAIGVYILEEYKSGKICCSLAKIDPGALKIIYPSGFELLYLNESTFLKNR
jgi:hypothetical protein